MRKIQYSLYPYVFIVFFIIKCSRNWQVSLSTLHKCHFGLSVDTQMNRKQFRGPREWTSTSVQHSFKNESKLPETTETGRECWSSERLSPPAAREAYQGKSLFTQRWPIRANDGLSRPAPLLPLPVLLSGLYWMRSYKAGWQVMSEKERPSVWDEEHETVLCITDNGTHGLGQERSQPAVGDEGDQVSAYLVCRNCIGNL